MFIDSDEYLPDITPDEQSEQNVEETLQPIEEPEQCQTPEGDEPEFEKSLSEHQPEHCGTSQKSQFMR